MIVDEAELQNSRSIDQILIHAIGTSIIGGDERASLRRVDPEDDASNSHQPHAKVDYPS